MRVTTSNVYLTSAAGLGSALGRVQEQSGKLSSGKSISKWSDDAPSAATAEALREQESDLASFARSAGDAKGWLDTADGALQSMSSLLTRVRELATSSVNGGLSPSNRDAVADEVKQLRNQLRDLGQSQYLGRPLFGGFGGESGTALQSTGDEPVTWAGDSEPVRRQISPTVLVQVNVDGAKLFGFDGGGSDVFATLDALTESVRSNDTAKTGELQARLAQHADAVGSGLARIGATTNRVDAVVDAGSTSLVDLASRRSGLEEIDIADAILKLNAAQASYQAALGATAKSNLPSLADFLK
ncbi:MAG: flgL [Frankiales bacterium]|nr:flgL [Frankiales bacterium]